MSSLAIAAVVMIALVVAFGFVQIENLIKLTFGTWVLLGWSLSIGTSIWEFIKFLSINPDLAILGIKQGNLAEFFVNAQPMIMLISSGLLLWFFLRYGQLKLSSSEHLLHKILWPILSMGSLVSLVWLSLFSIWGGLYDWLFGQGDLLRYHVRFPVFVMIMALFTLLVSSKVNIKLSLSSNPVE